MSQTSKTTSGGTGISTVLFLIFLVLKLTETIDWSWWWVTAPIWIPIAFWFSMILIIGIFALLNR